VGAALICSRLISATYGLARSDRTFCSRLGGRDLPVGFRQRLYIAGPRANCVRARPVLRRSLNWHLPSEQEKAVTTKTATAGLKKPLQSRLHGIQDSYASKVDGSAIWAPPGEEPHGGADHELTSAFATLVAVGPA